MNLKIYQIVLDERIKEMIENSYDSERELIFLLKGKILNDVVYVIDLYYVEQYANKKRVLFRNLPSNYIGTLHTHPYSAIPSKEDLMVFNKLGGIHVIFDGLMWRGFDYNGNELIVRFSDLRGLREKEKPMSLFDLIIYIAIIVIFFTLIVFLMFYFLMG
ncbi:MAG: hypothetical protein QXD62_03145 [Candidatus Woesearchaeota archaeon]